VSKRVGASAWIVALLVGLLVACGATPAGPGGGAGAGQSPTAASGRATPIAVTGHRNTPTPTAVPRRHPPTPTPPPSTPTAVLEGGSGPYGPAPAPTAQENQLVQQLFALINSDRAAQGLAPYVLNSVMSAGARLHSWNIAHCGLSHACPGEAAPCDRVSAEGISWSVCGENVGYASAVPDAWSGVQLIEKSMLDEQPPNDGHRRNLLSSDFRRIGIGIYLDAQGYVWVTEDFAS
jgi:uncharacterized protein YkwD